VEFGSQGDGFARKDDVFSIQARRNQDQISAQGGVDGGLDSGIVLRNPDGRVHGNDDLVTGRQLSIVGRQAQYIAAFF
jgi:hypothetical protein